MRTVVKFLLKVGAAVAMATALAFAFPGCAGMSAATKCTLDRAASRCAPACFECVKRVHEECKAVAP